MDLTKIDSTGGAVSPTDVDGRWVVLQSRLGKVRAEVPTPLASGTSAGCDLTFWSADASITVSATQGEMLVGYLVVVRKNDWLLGGDVAVKKAYRRAGIATAMYDFAEEVMGAKFRPCTPHSVHAAAFWSGRTRNTNA
ncbi:MULTISPECIES: GNAT family N-acetyltransferase [Burkholderia]|uniref:GNAT family N-acetyltransferase n=1 Tax=Burkholderia contaminans TaxID=488447 RepID=A0AAP1V5A2_9BURK|nr:MULTISPECIES: GNAT family N-acetyltransferase [Burkholderia]MBK1902181.1 GNAT family N-acetyltransferase [Burkholderia contaminans]MBK1910464.1 GNAT family N-acetyltransferase [Burkholderia contaminans]MBK1923923.1 GNAT family N-acetyltransferase [Burkholderia contaminans]MBK1932135.1 GNAT family N-acetyltransferase [Burkholderia contaminans]MBK1939384.1 GNAT family N-acetyltransferase [Burkholderia contaminans]